MKRLLVAIIAIALLVGCSSNSHRPAHTATTRSDVVDGIPIPGPATTSAVPVIAAPTSCPAALRVILSRADSHGSITVRSRGSTHELTCSYQDRAADPSACTRVTSIINTEPQAFTAFQRWTVETGQNSMWSNQPALNPVPVSGIGVEAEWVPGNLTFETATMNTWVAIFLTCPTRGAARLHLATALARAALAATA